MTPLFNASLHPNHHRVALSKNSEVGHFFKVLCLRGSLGRLPYYTLDPPLQRNRIVIADF